MMMNNLTLCKGRVKCDVEFASRCTGRSKGGEKVSRQDALVGQKERTRCHVEVGRSLES